VNEGQPDLADAFHPSFSGGRQEREWIVDALRGFHEDRWFTEVLFRVKGGKEATVYCCRADPATGSDLLAAKVFRPRMFRGMRNDALYRQGRETLDATGKADRRTRTARAVRKGTRFGRAAQSTSWCQHEYATLSRLHEAGVDVPKPLTASENAILMEFVGDEQGAAPILQRVTLGAVEGRRVLDRLIEDVDRMLSEYVVHADLSAYNVLYRDGDLRIIDLPQAVDALSHSQGFDLLRRDIQNLCRYFARQGVQEDADRLALDLWTRHFG
jgi:RIO kinase 1